MATPSHTTVTGYPDFVNYVSGGQTASATLIGGDQGDYFIGGPGENTIQAGAGNDTVYAHPQAAAYKGKILVRVSCTNENATTPSVSIRVNGRAVIELTPITVEYGTGTQDFMIDAAAYVPISALSLVVTGTSYIDQNNFSNIEINDIIYDGKPLDLTAGVYTNGASQGGYTYSNTGTVTFPGSLFAGASGYLPDTRDVIDGGGGTNTVVYRGPYAGYSVTRQADGSWIVASGTTAEGPDALTNIQKLIFSDRQMDLP
jgi:hypothetical protein